MMDLLVADLDKEMTEAKVEEKNSQADYETLIKEAAAKRAQDSRALSAKGKAKASAEEALEKEQDTFSAAFKDLEATHHYIVELHSSCDWLLQHYDARKAARAGESESLGR